MPSVARCWLAAWCALSALATTLAQPRDVYFAPAETATISLNGTWDFKYAPNLTAAFDGTTDGFAPITVPGHWELQGFAEPKYGRTLAEGTGLYRRTFDVPAEWSGQRVMLRFEGVLYGYEVWVNGTKAGEWASGYNPATFDITEALQPAASNVLEVRVTTRPKGWEFDTNDCWSLSGLYRAVTLFAVPAAHLRHYTTRTRLAPDGSATLTVWTLTNAPVFRNGRLLAPDGAYVGALKFSSEENTAATATLKVPEPQLWTAETPALYTLELDLSSGQRIVEKIGLREITIAGGVLQLNGRPIKLRGVNHHDLWPDTGRTATEAQLRRDLELIKAANCNFVRTSHYPPDARLIELCDELGLYVMDEVPFGYGDEHLTDESYREILLTRARATVRRDENRPSVIVWSIGNENPNTPAGFAAAEEVKHLDSSRPVCFPQVGSYFGRTYPELPAGVDIYAPHYPVVATVREYAHTLARPIIHTEYAHALGLATDRIQEEWAIMQASPHHAGGAVWMFQDQGILRAATKSAAEMPPNPYVWPDAQHYYDTNNLDGMDGLVYSDRTPQTDYWQVRKVYSPVQITAGALTLQPGANELPVQVENRFDFRSLEGLTLSWALVRDGRLEQKGTLSLQAAAHATETVKVTVNGPAKAAGGFAWLELRCLDENGISFHERTLRLKAAEAGSPWETFFAGLPSSTPKLDYKRDEYQVRHAGGEVRLNPATGKVTFLDRKGIVLADGIYPHTGRKFTEAETLRAKGTPVWAGNFLTATEVLEVAAVSTPPGVTLSLRARYARPETTGQTLEGKLSLFIRPNGSIEVTYDYEPVDGKGTLLEAGASVVMPSGTSEFRWIGAGPYAGYPGKDALNEFGIFHLNRADLHFQGNRRQVAGAALTTPQGAGVLLIPDGQAGDVAVENRDELTVLSHNAVISGRGNKGGGPENNVTAEDTKHIAGRFTLVPLAAEWPALLRSWFGAPAAATPFQPFYRSYDQ